MRGSREDRGQATVEFALILPLLVLGVVVLVHAAVGLAVQAQLEAAAREGARAAALEPDAAVSEARSAVRRSIGDRTVSVTAGVDAEWITVEVTTVVRFLPFGDSGRTLRADATMRREDLIR